jgi:hypothetical protein
LAVHLVIGPTISDAVSLGCGEEWMLGMSPLDHYCDKTRRHLQASPVPSVGG